MNTKKMGNFIKQLRKEKNISRRELANKCYLESEKAVGDWENGNAIPDIEKLQTLSNVFSISIDEILDGERHESKNFLDIYIKADNQKMIELCNDKTVDYFGINREQEIKIIKRVDKLLKIRLNDSFSNNEENEFAFLIDNFYTIDVDACKKYASKVIKNPYVLLRSAIRNCLSRTPKKSINERLWELKKLIKQKDDISFDLRFFIMNGIPEKDSWFDKRFQVLDDLEKDMILMSIQTVDPIFDEDKIGSRNLQRHEEFTGRKFDKDKESRLVIKYLIENGACLNSFYLNFIETHHVTKRIIDKLEELYLLCKKPLDFYYGNGGEEKHYKVENTAKNRFIRNYNLFNQLNYSFSQRSIDEWFDIFSNNDEIPEEILMEYAIKNNMVTNKKERYFKADLAQMTQSIVRTWNEWKAKEKEIEEGNVMYDDLLKRLQSGETEYVEEEQEYVGGKNLKELEEYYRYCNSNVTYEDALGSRKQDETKELYDNLNDLTLDEMRNRYFKAEVYDDERDE